MAFPILVFSLTHKCSPESVVFTLGTYPIPIDPDTGTPRCLFFFAAIACEDFLHYLEPISRPISFFLLEKTLWGRCSSSRLLPSRVLFFRTAPGLCSSHVRTVAGPAFLKQGVVILCGMPFRFGSYKMDPPYGDAPFSLTPSVMPLCCPMPFFLHESQTLSGRFPNFKGVSVRTRSFSWRIYPKE